MTDKTEVKDGSTIKLIRTGTGWRVEVLHKGGGITGRIGPHDSFEEAIEFIRSSYEVENLE